ncbi:helix-turn-helix transcriptional regulator [Pollutimonas sp. H1-120]|uniref:AraC family transcriptional regulator n=1 Tax=Pollutimonas sp. H1-120 TaxID=3148824 RepID=UPI003B51CF4B
MSPKPPTSKTASGAPSKNAHSRNASASIANRVPRAVAALARSDPAGCVIAPHHHLRDQLIYAIEGVMTIRANGSIWTIPPSHGMWMPAHMEHGIRMDVAVEMRTLYFQPGVVRGRTDACCVLAITPLLRELVLRAMAITPRYDPDSAEGRMMQVLVDEVGLLAQQPLSLKLPADKRLLRLCEALLADVSSAASIAELGESVGLSERSVIRLFPKETGLSLLRWRQQARLMRAFALAEQGMTMTQIALELGYGSASAFSKMFRKLFGQAPRSFFRASHLGARSTPP